MQLPQLVRSTEIEAAASDRDCEYSLNIVGPTGPLEVSIDGAAYRPCRRAQGAWSLDWAGPLLGNAPTVVVIRKAAAEGPFSVSLTD